MLTTQKEISTATRVLSGPVKVHVVDPSAYTPPYDHALCAALARAGVDVELFTSRFSYGDAAGAGRLPCAASSSTAAPAARPDSPLRRALKLAEHVPDMLRATRRRARPPTSSTSSGSRCRRSTGCCCRAAARSC